MCAYLFFGVFVGFINNNNNIYFASDSWSISQEYSTNTVSQKWLFTTHYRAGVR